MSLPLTQTKSLKQLINQKIAQYTLLQQKKFKSLQKDINNNLNNNNLNSNNNNNYLKDKHKLKSIHQWNLNIIQLESEPGRGEQHVRNQQMSNQGDDNHPHTTLNQLLTLFLHSLLTQNHSHSLITTLFQTALHQPLTTLWHLQYTNKLSLAIHILTYPKPSNPSKPSTNSLKHKYIQKHPQNQNLNQFNLQSDCSANQQHQPKTKNKKKLKKNNKKIQLSPPSHKKHHQQPNPKNYKKAKAISEQVIEQNASLAKESKTIIEQINAEINRVEKLYFAEIQQYHTLPYSEVDSMWQKNLKTNKSTKQQSVIRPQTSNIYPFQEPLQSRFNSHNSHNSSNVYPLSGMFPQRQDHNHLHDMHFSSQYFPLMNPPISPMNMPYLHMSQHIGQSAHQGTVNHQIFGNPNFQNSGAFYGQEFLMMSMENFSQGVNQQNHTRPAQINVNNNSSSAKKVVMIENIDEDE